MSFETPEDIINEYNNGLQAAVCDPVDMMKLISELPEPFFGTVGNDIFGTGKGMLSLPFKAVQYFFPDFGKDEAQTTGDCVSHATRNAIDVTRAYEILYNKDKEIFLARGATEPIYGCRGHGGQGMQCSQAARFVSLTGGFLVRENYSDIEVDLSKYNSRTGINWGSRGIPDQVIQKCKNNQVGLVTTLNSIEQARDLLANGYGFSVCSNYGFSNIRDKNGVAEASGSWSHAMAWIGCDDTHEIYNETLFLVQNSWGLWNSGPKSREQPDGSFWIRQKVAEAMIGSGGSFAFSNFNGFKRKMVWTRIKEVFG